MRHPLTVIFVATLILTADPAAAGVIRGVLTTTPRPSAVGRDSLRTAKLTPQRGAGDAVVYLQKIPENVEKKLSKTGFIFRKPLRPQRIVQRNLRFVPRVVATAAGSLVEFENLDRVYHNTFSVSSAKRFDLGKYKPGTLDSVLFDRAGVVNLHCDIHPDESGFVVVVPNHAFARPDSLGRFVLPPKLPKGDYTLHVWHPRLGEFSRAVTMPAHGDLKLELKF
jgi:hypothetical protein